MSSLSPYTLYGPMRREALEVLRGLARDPAPVHRLAVPMSPTLIVGDGRLIHAALVEQESAWSRVPNGLGESVLPLTGAGGLGADVWVPALLTSLDPVAARWQNEAKNATIVEIFWELGATVLGSLAGLSGKKLDPTDARAWIDASRAAEDERFNKAMSLAPLPAWVPTDKHRRLTDAEHAVGELRSTLGDHAALGAFLSHAVPLLVASTLMVLAKAPPMEAAVRNELKGLGREPGPGDAAALPVLRRMMRETARLHSAAWAVERRPVADGELGGVRYRAGTRVLFCPWVAHRRADAWPDPEKFDPERHLRDPQLELWGGADETRLGVSLAEPAALLMLARLLRRARFKQMAGNPLVLAARLRLRVQNPVKMGLAPVAG